jgi:hypothetical protein
MSSVKIYQMSSVKNLSESESAPFMPSDHLHHQYRHHVITPSMPSVPSLPSIPSHRLCHCAISGIHTIHAITPFAALRIPSVYEMMFPCKNVLFDAASIFGSISLF